MRRLSVLMSTLCLFPAAPALAERGDAGDLRVIYWQASSTLNPYLSTSGKDVDPASLALEPLAGIDGEGNLFPRLAAEVPTVANGGIAPDHSAITWRLKPGLVWSDGSPVTAADVKFTADYCMAEGFGCAVAARFQGISSVEVVDDLTVTIHFDSPKFAPYQAFVGSRVPVLQAAQFADCLGPAGAACTAQNFAPIGTGPFVVTDFRPNDVATFEANPNYRDAALPRFARVIVKGGGDPAGAARAVLETGEYDFGWNLMLAPEILAQMEQAGRGQTFASFGTMVERIELNQTDPSADLGAERSTLAHPHPFLTDPAVRAALSMAIDRELLVEIGYGMAGRATCNIVPAPAAFVSDNTGCLTQDIAGANALLDQAGWLPGPDGIRQKDGVRLHVLFQSSASQVRQDIQALVKQWWREIGVETDLKVVDGSVFFGGDPASPDTIQKLFADVQMYTNSFDNPDPEAFMGNLTCARIPSPENQWQGNNFARFCETAYDEGVARLRQTADPDERAALVKMLNDMPTKDSNILIPLVYRGMVSGHVNSLTGVQPNAWESDLWNIQDWNRSE
ncbi:MAG: peptide ABC transporter substrate-binding protein [Paracoccus sp. (in: a-proteobacteria)]|uniref:peptide ABC transporter substrate-binding protein n=1 Tax=Paracoccus sp. TaxID=267 RepID=UPI0026DF50E8|nr:peptide ABC transporter substrate-binding protein [Paracoccus sp. (in: a-proteobacteria)]MDO5612779.1 peptide ABC transporter substrate-binding protein [Paracoccus sp. (in: a-proteobacteria)]